jgi:putative ABC transport system permease protein
VIRLALRSLRFRRASFIAAFVSVVLSTALIGSFATLVAAAGSKGISGSDRTTLLTMGAVVGSWGALIALFSLTSTLGITVRQRDTEIGLLRTIGSTPRQARRMIRSETFVLAALGSAVGAAVALAGGAALLALLRSTEVVSDGVQRGNSGAAVAVTAAGLVLVSLLAASIAARRATSGSARMALVRSADESGRLPRWRLVIGTLLIVQGLGMATVTVTALKGASDPYTAMQSVGSAAIITAIGLAALGPLVLRCATVVIRPLLALAGPPGYLAGFNASRRARVLSGVLGPVIVFTATSVAVLMVAGIDGRTLDALAPDKQEQHAVTLLNYVISGMIAVFAAIMVVNAIAAVTSQRGTEFERLHLVGATHEQVRASVRVEASLVASIGIVLGVACGGVSVVPYSVVRHEGVVPNGQLWVPLAIAAVAAAITLVSSGTAARRVRARVPR